MLHFQTLTSDKFKKIYILIAKTYQTAEPLVSAAPPMRTFTFRKIEHISSYTLYRFKYISCWIAASCDSIKVEYSNRTKTVSSSFLKLCFSLARVLATDWDRNRCLARNACKFHWNSPVPVEGVSGKQRLNR